MIKTDEYAAAGRAIARGAIDMGRDETSVRAAFELCFSMVMEVFEKEER